MFWRKKNQNREEAPTAGGWDDQLTLEQANNLFNNIAWARDAIGGMFEAVIAHKEVHDCPEFCLPASVGSFLNQLPREGLLILLGVVLKDVVLEEDTGDSENEDVV